MKFVLTIEGDTNELGDLLERLDITETSGLPGATAEAATTARRGRGKAKDAPAAEPAAVAGHAAAPAATAAQAADPAAAVAAAQAGGDPANATASYDDLKKAMMEVITKISANKAQEIIREASGGQNGLTDVMTNCPEKAGAVLAALQAATMG